MSMRDIKWHQEKSSLMTQVGYTRCSKMEGDSLVFYSKCNSLEWLLVTFFGIVVFISLRFFIILMMS